MNFVDIDGKFKICRYPVTNQEYARFVAATGRYAPDHWEGQEPPVDIAEHPVVNVSWHDAVAYCEWLTEVLRESGKIGNDEVVRLPTEDEWEYAATGGDERTYPWGDDWDPDRCNSAEGGIGTTTPVGHYSPQGDSPFGVADMAGNVWEWTMDHEGPYRVVRGGSFNDFQRYARCACRYRDAPVIFWYYNGFRCVVVLN